VAFVGINLHQFLEVPWEPMIVVGTTLVLISLPVFGLVVRRRSNIVSAADAAGLPPWPAWSKLQTSLFLLKKQKGVWGIAPAGSGQRPSATAD
jgi:hypothetical protein